MKLQSILVIAAIALLLYWVVQDPIGAAAMIKTVFEWLLHVLELIANRVVQFLNALV